MMPIRTKVDRRRMFFEVQSSRFRRKNFCFREIEFENQKFLENFEKSQISNQISRARFLTSRDCITARAMVKSHKPQWMAGFVSARYATAATYSIEHCPLVLELRTYFFSRKKNAKKVISHFSLTKKFAPRLFVHFEPPRTLIGHS